MQKYKFVPIFHQFNILFIIKMNKFLTLLNFFILLNIYSLDIKPNNSFNDTNIYKNKIFKKEIKTLICKKNNTNLSQPIINLNSNEKLSVSFDDLEADVKDYYYTIIHCNRDWRKSNLLKTEYINGFEENRIENFEFSFNTIQKYTHYNFEFPNDNIAPIISGNYIFEIFDENKETIAHVRFLIIDHKVSIKAEVRKATLANVRNTKHEIDFTIKHPNINVSDPFSEIQVVIKQNNQEHNPITNIKPIFIKENTLIYDYEDENTFYANNEFRYFDIRSLRYKSERVKNIYFKNNKNHIELFNEYERKFNPYSIQVDINGQFFINSQEAWDSSIESDYAYVYFSLIKEINHEEIYIVGDFTNWEINNQYKLSYNNHKYETVLYLKQGYYNYLFGIVKDNGKLNMENIEGSHYETRNDYHIYVYYRPIGEVYDQLIGFLKTSSKNLF